MDVYEESVVVPEHQRGLHRREVGERRRKVRVRRGLEEARYLADARLRVAVLLRLVVRRNPPRRGVARNVEARALLDDREVGERLSLSLGRDVLARNETGDGVVVIRGEFVAESHSVVEHAEAQVHAASGALLHELDEHLLVAVAYLALLAPHGPPRRVRARALHSREDESRPQLPGLASVEGVLAERLDVETEGGRLDDFFAAVGERIRRLALFAERKGERVLPVGGCAGQGLRKRGDARSSHREGKCKFSFHAHIVAKPQFPQPSPNGMILRRGKMPRRQLFYTPLSPKILIPSPG